MAGWEINGADELEAIKKIYSENQGILFAHGFDSLRKRFYVRELEQKFAEKMGCKHAQAVTSGSAGLYVALKSLGIGQGDEVIIPAFTFIATSEAVLLTGATPVCVDIDDNYNIDCDKIEKALTEKTRCIIPVHMAGSCCDMDRIMLIAHSHDIYVVEDACQACGATYKGKLAGTIGELGVISLDFGKIITSGEGGIILTNHDVLYYNCRAIHDHGHTYDNPNRAAETQMGIGFNFRMTELQAAVGLVQLGKLFNIIEIQKTKKNNLKEILKKHENRFRVEEGDNGDSLFIKFDSKQECEETCKRLKDNGYGTKNVPDALNWHFAGNWKNIFPENKWKRSQDLLERSIALPISLLKDYDERIKEII
jgi:8-amino-3,8-dideoxy-alpha-D-manno-octulosonate transaminase